jgi:dTDP-4-amino-4,6-dideoxygalactose transaminase
MTAPEYIVFGAPSLGNDEIAEVTDSLRSGWIGTGPKVARFEEMIRAHTGARHAVAVNSCTAALHLSLLAAGIGPGDEVITTAMTFVATVNAILHVGATPVLVDCERDTQLIDTAAIAAAITDRTRAIIPVHMCGRVCDMTAIEAIARKHNLTVIEDAAHALEGGWQGRNVGTMSKLTCFSFYVTKNVTTGEGGAVTTDDQALADRIKTLALHGMSRDAWKRFSDRGYKHYQVVEAGFKYNMMDLQAAIGIHQLKRVRASLHRRQAIWTRYTEAFADLAVTLPAPIPENMNHALHLYTLMIDEQSAGVSRDDFMARLHADGVGTGVHYIGVHCHPYYQARFGWAVQHFPNASWISERTVSIPLSPGLTDLQVDRVITAVRTALPA